MAAEDRKERERQFHDEAFGEGIRKGLSFAYDIVDCSRSYFQSRLFAVCLGREVLEYGCGMGSHAFLAAQRGARQVTGIDISAVAIEKADERARRDGFGNVQFRVMDCEAMEFPDDSFDVVCGTTILHHLDLSKAIPEIARVLRPGGKALFIEPLNYNPLVFLFRRLTPQLRSSDERPFTLRDLRFIKSCFAEVEYRYYHLTSLLTIPFGRTALFNPLLGAAVSLDRFLLDRIPLLRPLAWQVVMSLEKPVKKPAVENPTQAWQELTK
jgi:SAM-dependent methyltransferase